MMKEWPEDATEAVDFESLTAPVAKMVREGYDMDLRLKKGQRVPKLPAYDGLNIGKRDRACCPPPTEQFNRDGLLYNQERDRDLLDVAIMVAVQLGIEQGRRLAAKDHEWQVRCAYMEGRQDQLAGTWDHAPGSKNIAKKP